MMFTLREYCGNLRGVACMLLILAFASYHNRVSCDDVPINNNNLASNNNNIPSAVAVPTTFSPALSKVANDIVAANDALPATQAPAPVAAPADQANLDSKAAPVAAPTPTSPAPRASLSKTVLNAIKPSSGTTSKPLVDKILPGASQVGDAAKKVASVVSPASAIGAALKLAAYFEPICQSLDRLLPQDMLKIHSQLKSFVEKSLGKMSSCFMQHYGLDPNLTQVGKQHLGTICTSRSLAPSAKGAFHAFTTCAESNWEHVLGTELDRINKLRLNCFTNHPHSANDTRAALSHDDENVAEASLITDVVNKVLDGNKSAVNKSDIQFIDMGSKSHPSAAATGPGGITMSTSNSMPSKKILNDPNTVVVFVDEPATTAKPAAPAMLPISSIVPAITKNVTAAVTSVLGLGSTQAPAASKATSLTNAAVSTGTSAKPAVRGNATLSLSTGDADKVRSSTPGSTTPAPSLGLATKDTSKSASDLAGKIIKAASTAFPAKLDTRLSASVSAKPGESKTATSQGTTPKPSGGASKSDADPTPSSKPSKGGSKSDTSPEPSAKPKSGDSKSDMGPSTSAKPQTSGGASKSDAKAESSSKPSASTTSAPQGGSKSGSDKSTSTSAPTGGGSSTTAKPESKSGISSTTPSSNSRSGLADILPPKDGLNDIFKERRELEAKMKAEQERLAAQLLKKQRDEIDAKNAIRALQFQRSQHTASDEHLHQLEHQRQMFIDPIGHTIKHQQYEQSKQNRASAAAASVVG